MPSFVSRVERPDRGGAWAGYLADRRAAGERWAARLGLQDADPADARPSVALTHVDGDEEQLLGALLFEAAGAGEERIRATVAGLSDDGARRAPARPGRRAREPPPPARAAGSRRSATASRSCRTTARSATSSATGC